MPTTTSNQALTLPAGSDNANVPTSMTAYNTGVENRLVQRFTSSADRSVRNATPTEGELSYLIDSNRYEYYTGAAWTPVVTSGYIGETVRTSIVGTFTTTETVVDTFTFTALSTLRYDVFSVLNLQSTVANDIVQVRFRWEAGGTLTTAGTEFHSIIFNCDIVNRGNPAVLRRTITSLSGQVTVGTTAVRNSGTGNISSFGAASQNNILVITSI